MVETIEKRYLISVFYHELENISLSAGFPLSKRDIKATDCYVDYGIGSIDYLCFIDKLSKQLEIDIDVNKMATIPAISASLEYLCEIACGCELESSAR